MFRVVKAAGKRAGVPWVGLHTLRHTAATILFRRGWNAVQVQKFLGHHSPGVHARDLRAPAAGRPARADVPRRRYIWRA